jgi:sec-independent protein translocase protein TatB
MFGIDSSELIVIALVALLVIGPKDLPKAMRWVGQWAGKARAMSRHLRTGFDTMMREAELEEMQKLWAAQNEAIMKASALPENLQPQNMLPDLAGPTPAADPWPTAPTQSLPEPAPEAAPEPAAPPPRKPRARKAKTADPAPSDKSAA